jgi:hypothetical protein
MKLKELIKITLEFFKNNQMDYAVVGGFALHAYGYMRATRDIDFITRTDYQKKIVSFLESSGFETLYCSDGFSNHLHSDRFSRIDLIYIEGETAIKIFSSSTEKLILGDLRIPVVSPEHLIALKLFSIKNNPARKFRELADIKEIIQLQNPDRDLIRGFFTQFGQEVYFDEITND